jgi:hypothetical protein
MIAIREFTPEDYGAGVALWGSAEGVRDAAEPPAAGIRTVLVRCSMDALLAQGIRVRPTAPK